MAKQKTVYVCSNCGADSPKWLGKCPNCGSWNSYVEEVVVKEPAARSVARGGGLFEAGSARPTLLRDITAEGEQRLDLGDAELNRVLGGGLVRGSLVLIGGEPGIGKSTLVLQTVLRLKGLKTLYVSGEESSRQLKLRADRLSGDNPGCYVLCETNLEKILTQAANVAPDLMIIDSIQTIFTEMVESSPGSVSQVRECSALILKYAKESGVPVLLIGHINKEGSIAGPKVLEHIVDAVLQFEGDQHYMYRVLRSIKNRFGSTAELGIYEMRQDGLREVSNPSELLLRMSMLLAVLEKRAGFKLVQKDVFLNIAGGLRVNDPAIDLAVISAVLSSSLDIAIEPGVCMTGEVGLSGEIRPVNRIEQRILEAEKLGFSRILIPAHNLKGFDTLRSKIQVVQVRVIYYEDNIHHPAFAGPV